MSRRILILAEYGTRNGGENSLLAILPLLRSMNWAPLVGCPAPSDLSAAVRSIEVECSPFDCFLPDGVRKPLPQIRHELASLILKTKPTLVHANSLNMSRMLGPVANEIAIPATGHIRDIIKLSRQAIRDLNQLDRLICVSAATRDFHRVQRIAFESMEVIYNGIDLQKFCPRKKSYQLHQRFGLPENAFVLLGVGQIGLRKGWDMLLTAVQTVFARVPAAHLVVVGERLSTKQESVDFEAGLLDIARVDPLRGRVHFVGRQAGVDLLMNDADLLVHPARQEPLGRVLIEAAASGLAAVATDVGGTNEIFSPLDPADPVAARLVPAGEPARLSEEILNLYRQPPLRAQLAKQARQIAESRFEKGVAARAVSSLWLKVGETANDPAE